MKAQNNGAEILQEVKKISETAYDKTILINPTEFDKISKNEIFGPVVCIYSYDNIDKAIEKSKFNKCFFSSFYFFK